MEQEPKHFKHVSWRQGISQQNFNMGDEAAKLEPSHSEGRSWNRSPNIFNVGAKAIVGAKIFLMTGGGAGAAVANFYESQGSRSHKIFMTASGASSIICWPYFPAKIKVIIKKNYIQIFFRFLRRPLYMLLYSKKDPNNMLIFM